MIRRAFLSIACFFVSTAAFAGDGRVDCKKPADLAEQTICADDKLSHLDRRTAVIFGGLSYSHRQVSGSEKPGSSLAALIQSQADWRKQRAFCGTDTLCLKDSLYQRFYSLIGRKPEGKRQPADGFLGEYDYLERTGSLLITRISPKQILFFIITGNGIDTSESLEVGGFVKAGKDAAFFYLQENDPKPCAKFTGVREKYFILENKSEAGCQGGKPGKMSGMYKIGKYN